MIFDAHIRRGDKLIIYGEGDTITKKAGLFYKLFRRLRGNIYWIHNKSDKHLLIQDNNNSNICYGRNIPKQAIWIPNNRTCIDIKYKLI